jgi:simple sugar transport system ATP-binding protein
MATLLRLDKLSKRYVGTQALDAVDLAVDTGQVLCLAGMNGSGKSTLVKCVSGAEKPDSGAIIWEGQSHASLTPAHAMRLGIQVIYQDLAIFPDLTAAENIAFHQVQHGQRLWIDWKTCRETARRELEALGADVPLDTRLGDLSIGARQTVAIARALTQQCRLLVMDEPTTALPSADVERLLAMVRRLQANGMAVVFVSHKLDELFEIADRFSVLRDGRKVGDYLPSELDTAKLSYLMTGVRLPRTRPEERFDENSEPVLRVANLTRAGQYRHVSFSLRAGEIIGFAGLMGAGRTEIALSLFGLNPPDGGAIFIDGQEMRMRSPMDAVRAGIALVSEDRHGQGLFQRQPIHTNIACAVYPRISWSGGVVADAVERALGMEWVRNVRVKTPSSAEPVRSLSGGNQQKVVLARWLATEPRILILDNPTAGIDVASKIEIHGIVRDMAQKRCAVLMISDDVEELALDCNRVFVLTGGTIAQEFTGAELTAQALTAAMRETTGASACPERAAV